MSPPCTRPGCWLNTSQIESPLPSARGRRPRSDTRPSPRPTAKPSGKTEKRHASILSGAYSRRGCGERARPLRRSALARSRPRGAERAPGARARWISNARLVGFGLSVALLWPVFVTGLALEALGSARRRVGFVALVLWHERARAARTDAPRRGAEFYARGLARLDLSDAPGATPASDTSTPSTRTPCTWTCSGAARCSSSCRRRRRSAARSGWPSGCSRPRPRRTKCARARRRSPSCGRGSRCARTCSALGPRARRQRARRSADRVGDGAEPARRLARCGSRRRRCQESPSRRSGSRSRARPPGCRRSAWSCSWSRLTFALQRRVAGVLGAIEPRLRDLDRLAALLARLEAEPYEAPRLRATRAALDHAARPASRQIAQLHRLVALLDWRRNQLFAPIARRPALGSAGRLRARVLARAQRPATSRAGSPRSATSRRSATWPATPSSTRPTRSRSSPSTGPLFARALGHPLLLDSLSCSQRPRARRRAPARRRLRARTCRARARSCAASERRAILGLAGAPVRAQRPPPVAARARCVPARAGLAARRRVALLRRAARAAPRGRAVQAAAPVLFLLDEILNGTNSHDRRIGADALLEGTARARRSRARDDARPRADCDRRRAARRARRTPTSRTSSRTASCRFDYRLRPGVIERGNALELMRSVGLEI